MPLHLVLSPASLEEPEIIAFYAQIIAQSLKLPAQFSALAPKIEQFLREKAYGQSVDLNSAALLQDLNRSQVLIFTEKVFLKLLRPLLTEEKTPVVSGSEMRLSTVPPFPWSGKIAECRHTLYNVTPVGNAFEQEFANFLDRTPEIVAFANIGNLKPNLSIEYLDGEANLRQYEPDFIAHASDGTHWLLETKGREDADVARKDERAEKWCEDVSTLTGQTWRYLKVPDKEFKRLKPATFDELVSALQAGKPMFIVD